MMASPQDERRRPKRKCCKRALHCDESGEIELGRAGEWSSALASKSGTYATATSAIAEKDASWLATADFLREYGFDVPIVVRGVKPAGLSVPSNCTVSEVCRGVGRNTTVDVLDVLDQDTAGTWSLDQWEKYWNGDRDRIYNVITLEISNTPLGAKVSAPDCVDDLDWTTTVGPSKRRWVTTEYEEGTKKGRKSLKRGKPIVQKYCLMSVAGCFTDFHVDFGGTSVWYHVSSGAKTFYVAPPTPENLRDFERWSKSPSQASELLPDYFLPRKELSRLDLDAGDTLLLPGGWIHAVVTPVDSVVFGGNWLHHLSLRRQLEISALEDRIGVSRNARMPFFDLILWYAAVRIANKLYALHNIFRQPRMRIANQEAIFQSKLFVLGGSRGLEAARYLALELGMRLETTRLVVGIHIPAEIKHPKAFLDGLDALLDGDDPPDEELLQNASLSSRPSSARRKIKTKLVAHHASTVDEQAKLPVALSSEEGADDAHAKEQTRNLVPTIEGDDAKPPFEKLASNDEETQAMSTTAEIVTVESQQQASAKEDASAHEREEDKSPADVSSSSNEVAIAGNEESKESPSVTSAENHRGTKHKPITYEQERSSFEEEMRPKPFMASTDNDDEQHSGARQVTDDDAPPDDNESEDSTPDDCAYVFVPRRESPVSNLYDGPHDEMCSICGKSGTLLCCDFCPNTEHEACSVSPDSSQDESLWACAHCQHHLVENPADGFARKKRRPGWWLPNCDDREAWCGMNCKTDFAVSLHRLRSWSIKALKLHPLRKRKQKGTPEEEEAKKKSKRRRRCGECENCKRVEDCGSCRICLNKSKFGGPGTLKAQCTLKRCTAPVLPVDEDEQGGNSAESIQEDKTGVADVSLEEKQDSRVVCGTTAAVSPHQHQPNEEEDDRSAEKPDSAFVSDVDRGACASLKQVAVAHASAPTRDFSGDATVLVENQTPPSACNSVIETISSS